MSRLSSAVAGSLLSPPAGRPPRRTTAGIRVAVSVPPQAYFVERIGGERVRVEVMIPPGYSHVDYPLTPRQVRGALPGAALCGGGAPGLRVRADQLGPVLGTLPGIQVVDMSRGMRLLAGDEAGEGHGGHGHSHAGRRPPRLGGAGHGARWRPATSPPLWTGSTPPTPPSTGPTCGPSRPTSPPSTARSAPRLAGRRGGARSWSTTPPGGTSPASTACSRSRSRPRARSRAPQRLIQLIDAARRDGVKVVFVQAGFPRKSAQVIAEAVGGRVLVADPQEPDWLGNLRRVTASSRRRSRMADPTSRWSRSATSPSATAAEVVLDHVSLDDRGA